MSAAAEAESPRVEAVRAALFDGLAEGEFELPAMPGAAADVLAELESPDGSLRRAAQLLAKDSGLAARVLRAGNSALRAGLVPIQNLPEAAARLGVRALVECVTAAALADGVYAAALGGIGPKLWQHAHRSGLWARELARSAQLELDGALLVGLLHDVGRPLALGLLLGAERRSGERLAQVERREAVDVLHTHLGAMLVGEWSLPAHLGAAAENHHDPELETRYPDTALLAHLADRLQHVEGLDAAEQRTALAGGLAEALARFGVDAARAQELLDQPPRE
ncbi:MAG: HDOD domain-containing protein [Planctomycetaceae bacterium]|nr:HDOD domain-containing protein [Planctomycetaceae bacterium]